MESEIILLDTGILIDYFRKKNKSKSTFYSISKFYNSFAVSIVTKYEIMVGSTNEQSFFWQEFFEQVEVIPFDENCLKVAVSNYKYLRRKNQLIEIEDLFIGSTGIAYNLKIATLNPQHFQRMEKLQLLEMNV
ncbi:type II toxin-antitoxin system VapC family toxin [Aquiflexum lacus]|uniref:type II toxin-antitoxin system VapC family toxin n=1 Tax=Aquiflexum lacus TaxID=2483805 RepID=UPI001E2D56DD|nr:type II toxin-antitoxin system VapC family toxin [Aquiflexum lacus]